MRDLIILYLPLLILFLLGVVAIIGLIIMEGENDE
jgi:hypothetical protein